MDEQIDGAVEQRDTSAERRAESNELTEEQEQIADDQSQLADEQKELQDEQADLAEAQQDLAEEQSDIADLRAGPVQVRNVATVRSVLAPSTVTEIDGDRAVTVTATPDTDDLGALTAAVQQSLGGLDLAPGISADIGGASDDQAESFRQLGLAMLVAIVFVFLIMVATFRSLVQPLILLTSIPFAATGAVAGLLITDIPLGVPAMVGLLLLIGIVVTNAIVLIDLINKIRARGEGLESAVRHGARLRLRPIIMTATATICALIPLGLALTGGGAFISQPLAVVVIGGLVSSTLLTLVLVPALYVLTQRRGERKRARREAATTEAADGTSASRPADDRALPVPGDRERGRDLHRPGPGGRRRAGDRAGLPLGRSRPQPGRAGPVDAHDAVAERRLLPAGPAGLRGQDGGGPPVVACLDEPTAYEDPEA